MEKIGERYRLLLENMEDGVAHGRLLTDEAGVPVDCVFLDGNAALARIMGLSPEEVKGRSGSELSLAGEVAGPRWLDLYARAAVSRETLQTERPVLVRGHYYQVKVFPEPELCFSVLWTDVTEGREKGERVKESTCLHQVARLLRQARQGSGCLGDVGEEVVSTIAAAFQFPERTGVRLTCPDCDFRTPGYRSGPHSMSRDLEVHGQAVGRLEVTLLDDPEPDSDSFLAEEELMLDTLAQHLSGLLEQRQAEAALREREEDIRITLDSIGDAVVATDTGGCVVRMNPVAQKLTGWPLEEARGQSLTTVLNLINARTREPVENPVAKVLASGRMSGLANHTVLVARDGTEYQVADSASPIRDANGMIQVVVMVFRDVTEEYRLHRELAESEARFRAIVSSIQDIVFTLDREQRHTGVYGPWVENLGLKKEDFLGKTARDIMGPEASQVHCQANEKALQGEFVVYDWSVPTGAGKRHYQTSLSPIWGPGGEVEGLVGVGRDITERKEAEEWMQYIGSHDSLTGLYNRAYLEDAMQRLDTPRQLPTSLIMVDLNGLKLVNDTYGHSAGDRMLQQAATILRESCRQEDIIARWGGDEFVIFLPGTSREGALTLCQRIRKRCRGASIDNIPISMALGAATRENESHHMLEFLTEAEDEMYRQKLAEGRSARSLVLNTLLRTLEAKSFETQTHTRHMEEVALAIGEKLGLPDSELDRLKLVIAMHDIGKINVSESILVKEGPLQPEEWEIIKKHPETGYRIARATEEFAHVAEDILAHHERWDGTGYPQGLAGRDIPLLARIAAIVDSYEVMSNGRPYKSPLSEAEVIAELRRCAGTQFDPELIDVFLDTLGCWEG